MDNSSLKSLNSVLINKSSYAYKSTGVYCLDLFSNCGTISKNKLDQFYASLFYNAFDENPETALKILFYLRDKKRGLGLRLPFHFLISQFANIKPELIVKLFPYIIQYGRYDDLFCLLDVDKIKEEVLSFYRNIFFKDIENAKE